MQSIDNSEHNLPESSNKKQKNPKKDSTANTKKNENMYFNKEIIKTEIDFINSKFSHYEAFKRKISFLFNSFCYNVIWKSYKNIYPAVRNLFNLPFIIDTNQIELEITTDCNLKCFNCNRSCRQAPCHENMSIEQLKHFTDESIKAGKKWSLIKIIGGEPTLHPNIFEICTLLIDYKINFSPATKISIVTNGFGPKVNQVLEKLPAIIHKANSMKRTVSNGFVSYNVAPIDVAAYRDKPINFSRGCSINSNCGQALTRYGYYPCGAGASVDRVFGLNIGIKSFDEITEKKFRGQLSRLCKYCGHFKEAKDEIYDEKYMSQSWQKVYTEYKDKKPELTLYGSKNLKIFSD